MKPVRLEFRIKGFIKHDFRRFSSFKYFLYSKLTKHFACLEVLPFQYHFRELNSFLLNFNGHVYQLSFCLRLLVYSIF